jgi:hypothetical protein
MGHGGQWTKWTLWTRWTTGRNDRLAAHTVESFGKAALGFEGLCLRNDLSIAKANGYIVNQLRHQKALELAVAAMLRYQRFVSSLGNPHVKSVESVKLPQRDVNDFKIAETLLDIGRYIAMMAFPKYIGSKDTVKYGN